MDMCHPVWKAVFHLEVEVWSVASLVCIAMGCSAALRSRRLSNLACNILVTSATFWSSQLHACCVRDALQNFKGMFPIGIKA